MESRPAVREGLYRKIREPPSRQRRLHPALPRGGLPDRGRGRPRSRAAQQPAVRQLPRDRKVGDAGGRRGPRLGRRHHPRPDRRRRQRLRSEHDGDLEQAETMPLVFETLTRDSKAAASIPWLASEVIPEDGGARFRFRLRRGVRFHDGRAVSARDVRYSRSSASSRRERAPAGSSSPRSGAPRASSTERPRISRASTSSALRSSSSSSRSRCRSSRSSCRGPAPASCRKAPPRSGTAGGRAASGPGRTVSWPSSPAKGSSSSGIPPTGAKASRRTTASSSGSACPPRRSAASSSRAGSRSRRTSFPSTPRPCARTRASARRIARARAS